MLFVQHAAENDMRKRKLQIFLSSTYEDLIDERLAAMEAILAAGHIPAAMEQFAPGDETAWEKIRTWIDESDAFILILGGRYGSLEPTSGKSYAQLEYEYAVDKRKPFFALVVSDAHHEQRIKEFGLKKVDERENAERYKAFKNVVTSRLCGFWNDKKDIKAAIFQKLPEWAQKSDLVGWVRGDEAANPEAMNELARLSHENRELRLQMSSDYFDGLTFDQLSGILREHEITPELLATLRDDLHITEKFSDVDDLLGLFDYAYNRLAGFVIARGKTASVLNVLNALVGFGLVEKETDSNYSTRYTISQLGRRFRNHFLMASKPREGRETRC